jgi:hypothetical protein
MLLLALLATAVAVLVLLVNKLRGGAEEDHLKTSEMLTKFRELHAAGVLSDEEFRTIKAKLMAQLQHELKDSEGQG